VEDKMTKEEFKYLREECRRIWKYVAEHNEKPAWAERYALRCPACQIARDTFKTLQKLGIEDTDFCKYCPIDSFRISAKEEGELYCTGKMSLHRKWIISSDRKAALAIGSARWSWLKLYEGVIVDLPALRQRKVNEDDEKRV